MHKLFCLAIKTNRAYEGGKNEIKKIKHNFLGVLVDWSLSAKFMCFSQHLSLKKEQKNKTISLSITFDNRIPCLNQVHHSSPTSQDSDVSKGPICTFSKTSNFTL